MNIKTARTIPMSEILSKIGLEPTKGKQQDLWYYSPFRSEKTPSFHVNVKKNLWYDFGSGIGGDPISFVCAHLKNSGASDTVPDALRWLRNMFQGKISLDFYEAHEKTEQEKALVLKSVRPLTHIALIRYLESRAISREVAQKYLNEIRIYNNNSKKDFFAAAIKNEEGGYDYRNPYFKGCIKVKAITFIRGNKPNGGIHIFEGFMDFLSAVMQVKENTFPDDTIILNSLSCIQEATGYLRNYGYRNAYIWLDNDDAGKKATEVFVKFLRDEKIRPVQMNSNYQPFKDVNEWHVATMKPQGK